MQAEQNDADSQEADRVSDVSGQITTEPGSKGEGEAALQKPSLDLIFGILKNGRRRRVLKYLRDADGEVTLSDLAEHIAAIENDTTPKQLTSSQRKRVYVGLYQCHLPKMDDAGVVDYNQARGLIEPTDRMVHFEEYLDVEDEETSRGWYRYYAGISVVGMIPVVAALALGLASSVVTGLVVTALGGIGCLAAYHWQSAETA